MLFFSFSPTNRICPYVNIPTHLVDWVADIEQNAMNAAEITDKLGLHSLRQRAWVCVNSNCYLLYLLTMSLVYPIDLRYFWGWFIRGVGMAKQFSPKSRAQLDQLERASISATTELLSPCPPPPEILTMAVIIC